MIGCVSDLGMFSAKCLQQKQTTKWGFETHA